MQTVAFGVKVEGIDEMRASLKPEIANKAIRLALNDIARQVRTEAKREILEKWGVKAGKVNEELKAVKFATSGDLSAVIQAKGRPISLAYYGAREVRRVVRGKGGKYRQVKGVTLKLLRNVGVTYRGAFMATMANAHRGVFRGVEGTYHKPTRGKYAGKRGRTKIVTMASITIASMFSQVKVQQEVDKLVASKFPGRWDHHMTRLGG
jgi:hypothetical protein